MKMGSLMGGSGGSPSRASRTAQAFGVFRDIPQGDSLPETGRSTDEETYRPQAENLSSSRPSATVNHPPKSAEPDIVHDGTTDEFTNLAKGHAKLSPHARPSISPATNRSGVLAQNSLKLNLSPREVSSKHFRIVMSTKPSARQKRGLPQEVDNIVQHPRKSLKSDPSASKSDQTPFKEAYLEVESKEKIEAANEPSLPETLVLTSDPLKEVSNDGTTDKEFLITPNSGSIIETSTAPTEGLRENTFDTFNGGDPTTPRSSAMYNFNSAIRMLNPFKAVGNLFGRLSASHSPLRPQHEMLGSDEIAKQVDDRLQHFEERMLDRLLALQTANQSSSMDVHEIRSQPTATALLSSPSGIAAERLESRDLFELVTSPLQELDEHTATEARSSPLLPMSQFRKITLQPADLQLAGKHQPHALRGAFAAFLKSPTVGKSKPEVATCTTSDRKASFTLSNLFSSPAAKPNADETQILTNEYHDTDALMRDGEDALAGVNSSPTRGTGETRIITTTNNHESPRLRNKASQHLKKMASRMNLRSKKSTINDVMPIDTDDYRTMKKKNKDAILKDYLILQREKQELEKQLAMRNDHTGKNDSTIQVDNSATISTSKQIQDRETTNLLPVLLDSKIPDLRAGRKRSSSPGSQGIEHGRAKRRSMVGPSDGLSLPPALSSLDSKNAANASQSISEDVDTESPRHHETSMKTNESLAEEELDTVQASLSARKVPPVPAVPSKYRSKVPQPTKTKGMTRKRKAMDENWDGWDAEVF